MDQISSGIQEYTWGEIREEICAVNPALSEIIDEIDPPKDHTFFKVAYPFGAHVLKKSLLMLPDKSGRILPAEEACKDYSFSAERLLYSGTMPMGVLLNNTLEQHITFSDRVLPYDYFEAGKVFALWKVLDPQITLHGARVWDVTSGARSIFLLPKISDEVSFKRLKREFQLRSSTPRSLFEQWGVFKEVAQNSEFKTQWRSNLLFFSREWLQHSNDQSLKWLKFNNFLYKTVWAGSQFPRNYVIYNLLFSQAQQEKNLRPNPYLADTVKHIIAMSMGSATGFLVANDESCAPLYELERVFTEVYGLRNDYAAIFMRPGRYIAESDKTMYYSLRYPTALEFSPRSRNLSSTLKDLLEVKHILDMVKASLLSRADIENTPVMRALKTQQFDFFHSESDSLGEVTQSSEAPILDLSLQSVLGRQKGKVFCESSQFFKGCVSVRDKNE